MTFLILNPQNNNITILQMFFPSSCFMFVFMLICWFCLYINNNPGEINFNVMTWCMCLCNEQHLVLKL